MRALRTMVVHRAEVGKSKGLAFRDGRSDYGSPARSRSPRGEGAQDALLRALFRPGFGRQAALTEPSALMSWLPAPPSPARASAGIGAAALLSHRRTRWRGRPRSRPSPPRRRRSKARRGAAPPPASPADARRSATPDTTP